MADSSSTSFTLPTSSTITKMTSSTKDTQNQNAMNSVSEKATSIANDLINGSSSSSDSDSTSLHKIMMANGLFSESDMSSENYNKYFYPIPRLDPYNYVEGTREIVFFTRPSMPIMGYSNLERSSYFRYLNSHGYQHILNLITGRKATSSGITSPFMNILTNRITSNLDIPDISSDVLETAQNMWGTKILYPKSSMSSDEGASFTAEFEDTKYLEIYHLFKAWDHFRQGKMMGQFDPDANDIMNKILYDHIAVYKFIIANDGETLLYWCKWTGVFPESINRSTFSEIPKGGPLKVNIGFKTSGWFGELDPDILYEFNSLVGKYYSNNSTNYWDISNSALNYSADQSLVSHPVIIYNKNEGGTTSSFNMKRPYFEWIKKS